MSASDSNSAIYISDTPAQIKNKIKRHAFSGGGDTAELHAQNGGNTDVDVSYQYLRFFLEDDAELEKIREEYSKGTMSTMELKERCVSVISEVVKKLQDAKKLVTDDTVSSFMDPNRPKNVKLKPCVTLTTSLN